MTDPLREALERIAGYLPNGDGQAADAFWRFRALAAEALAAAPVEPERNDERAEFLSGEGTLTALQVHDWAREFGRGSSLPYEVSPTQPLMVSVVRPVEPEAWEYGFSAQGDVHDAYGRCATASEAQAMLAAMSTGYQRRAHIVRRRPGTAPGPWERVNPEPREDER